LVNDLETKTDFDLRNDRLYLYYTQLGRCMYTGESIDLFTLLRDTTSEIYDIDHIYPRSKMKDDSLENRVLVKKTANMQKGDNYPLPVSFMQQKALWNHLHNCKLIGDKKYNRLTSRKSLTDDDFANFIERQLVETRQSTKAFAELLKNIIPESDIVYVKANNVSEFRNNFEIVKVREINDLHHAKDAYLNIVVGNVYDVKFTRNPRNFIVNNSGKYNLRDLFKYDVKNQNCTAWKGGKEGTISTVKKTVEKNNILFTRYAYENKGEISDQQIMRKGKGQLPIKASDKRLHNIERYGGYNKASTAYFFLVEHGMKKERVRTIEFVPVYLAEEIEKDSDKLLRYCEENLNLVNPDIRIPKIKINALISYDGFLMHIKGRQNKHLIYANAQQLYIPKEYIKYLTIIYRNSDQVKSKKISVATAEKDFSNDMNIEIYDLLKDKLANSIYSKKMINQVKYLDKGRPTFITLTKMEQCEVIKKIIVLFKCVSGNTDLSLIGAGKSVGTLLTNKKLDANISLKIINKSINGVFSKEVDLNNI
jgi:CRISPR-associated endonuclease Csn1